VHLAFSSSRIRKPASPSRPAGIDGMHQPEDPASKPPGDTLDDITGDISWSQLEQSGKVPSPRSGHTACAIERLCYVFGGCGCEADGDEAHVYNDLHVFDMAARTWDRVDCPPETGMRRPHAAVR
jgi:hypothetical protein